MKFLHILVLIFGLTVFANAQKAILIGNVTDEFGAVIPYAKVEAQNNKGESFSTRTKVDGTYQLELAEGAYQIEVAWRTLHKFTVLDYFVYYKMQLDVVLQCKEGCEKIEDLIEEASVTKTTDTGNSNKILQRPLEKLPKKQNKTKRKNKNNK